MVGGQLSSEYQNMMPDVGLGPLGLVQVNFGGLGPLNWVAKMAVQDLVRHNIRYTVISFVL